MEDPKELNFYIKKEKDLSNSDKNSISLEIDFDKHLFFLRENTTDKEKCHGISLKCLYGRFKEIWYHNAEARLHQFPFDIYCEYPLILSLNGSWKVGDKKTRELIKNGGFYS
jgi:hypothetical protein